MVGLFSTYISAVNTISFTAHSYSIKDYLRIYVSTYGRCMLLECLRCLECIMGAGWLQEHTNSGCFDQLPYSLHQQRANPDLSCITAPLLIAARIFGGFLHSTFILGMDRDTMSFATHFTSPEHLGPSLRRCACTHDFISFKITDVNAHSTC
jgi:hypothetical protein